MNQKVSLITGANSGIGKETARALASEGHRILMVCRSAERGRAAQKELKDSTGNQHIDLFLADLSKQEDIRRVAQEILATTDQLDILVNNAGAVFTKRELSEDGLEMTFAVNHIGYFLLTMQLMPLIKATPHARVISVSSGAHTGGTINLNDLNLQNDYGTMKAYSQSKLANILFANELAARFQAKGIKATSNSLHPGFVASNFGRNSGLFFKFIFALLRPLAKSEKKGAETSIFLALSPEVEGVSGQYFDNSKPVSTSATAQDQELGRQLWEKSAELCGVSADI
ncbi:MAG: SDR family oxidoreductase [Ardenticatenaceae bacterium]|nr:SDR family oxidoreductase [Ardenticatenaceae bacterium]